MSVCITPVSAVGLPGAAGYPTAAAANDLSAKRSGEAQRGHPLEKKSVGGTQRAVVLDRRLAR